MSRRHAGSSTYPASTLRPRTGQPPRPLPPPAEPKGRSLPVTLRSPRRSPQVITPLQDPANCEEPLLLRRYFSFDYDTFRHVLTETCVCPAEFVERASNDESSETIRTVARAISRQRFA